MASLFDNDVQMCARCKSVLPTAATGRPRVHCSAACRQAGYRAKKSRYVHFRSDSAEWATPWDFFRLQDARYGPFDLDVCATPGNAKCATYYTREDDGLSRRWTGRVWMNPPYGRAIGDWVRKAWESVRDGDAVVVVALVPARPDTRWWHDHATRAEVEFIRGRLRFNDAGPAPFASALLVFRNAAHRYETTPTP